MLRDRTPAEVDSCVPNRPISESDFGGSPLESLGLTGVRFRTIDGFTNRVSDRVESGPDLAGGDASWITATRGHKLVENSR